jgi:hypothetical protein
MIIVTGVILFVLGADWSVRVVRLGRELLESVATPEDPNWFLVQNQM